MEKIPDTSNDDFKIIESSNLQNDNIFKIPPPSDTLKSYCLTYNVMGILSKGHWNEKNGVYCDKCQCQLNLSDNPYVISYKTSLSAELNDNYIDESLFNKMTNKDKKKYIKCYSCNYYYKK